MDPLMNAGFTAVLTNPLLTGISGAATTYSYSEFIVSLRGKMTTVAADSAQATPTTDIITGAAYVSLAASQGCVFLWLTKPDGTLAVAQGPVKALKADNLFQWDASMFPGIPDGYVPFAYVVVKNGSTGSAWVFGTGNWNATGIVVAVQNLCTLPDRVQVA